MLINLFRNVELAKIKDNLNTVLNEIRRIHNISNFKNLSIPKLVAVSKKQDDYKVLEALKAGQRSFGENRVQEAQQRWKIKLENFKNLELRLIGPLQTNKVKQALEIFDIIETIDREKLANEVADKFNKDVDLAKESFDRLLKARKKIKIVKSMMVNAPDTIQDQISDMNKDLMKEIKRLEDLFMMPEDVKGIQRNPNTVNAKLGSASYYIGSSWGDIGQNAMQAISIAHDTVDHASEEVSNFIEGAWSEYLMKINLDSEINEAR